MLHVRRLIKLSVVIIRVRADMLRHSRLPLRRAAHWCHTAMFCFAALQMGFLLRFVKRTVLPSTLLFAVKSHLAARPCPGFHFEKLNNPLRC
jgi:hypothetical protein